MQVTSFVVSAAVEKARRIIQDEQLISLDRAATARFHDLMDAAYDPKGRMSTFLKAHRGAMPKLRR